MDLQKRLFSGAFDSGLMNHRPRVVPILSSDYPSAAIRPANAILSPSAALRMLATFGLD
jgi:hypothetical protein